jgi:hypothetical protein
MTASTRPSARPAPAPDVRPDGAAQHERPFVVAGTIHGRRVEALVSGLPDVLAQIASWTRDDPDAVGCWGLRDDYSEPLMMPIRRTAGSVRGETARAAHLVRLLPGEPNGGVLTAVCGQRLPVVGVDALPLGDGMPCERCLAESVLAAPGSMVGAALSGSRGIPAELDRQIG